jgi:NAD-reducing hydrogenase large subunit
MEQILEWSQNAVQVAKNYTLENLVSLKDFGSFDSNHLSIVRPDGAYDIYDGFLRARQCNGELIFDQVENQNYYEYIAEEVKSWSYMKFPFIRSLGPEKGWYRVGPLARVNNCDYFTTPLAESERKQFMDLTDGKPNNITMAYHWARMIELLHSAEIIERLLNDSELQGEDLIVKGDRRDEAVGIIEAPRGTLFHHYRVNEDDQVTMANLIVSTTSNNQPMNRAVEKVADEYISGVPEITEGLLNHIEVAIRAYDPCLSCATHAMGQMPLMVELIDPQGRMIDRKFKE